MLPPHKERAVRDMLDRLDKLYVELDTMMLAATSRNDRPTDPAIIATLDTAHFGLDAARKALKELIAL